MVQKRADGTVIVTLSGREITMPGGAETALEDLILGARMAGLGDEQILGCILRVLADHEQQAPATVH